VSGPLVEVLLLSADRDRLAFRARTAGQGGAAPDVVARRLAGIPAGADAHVLHSTSWRFDGSRIVLTYVALPDPMRQAPGRRHVAPDLARGLDTTNPTPVRLSLDEVAAHACRHLAFLRATDAAVADASHAHRYIWELIDANFFPALAGALPMSGQGQATWGRGRSAGTTDPIGPYARIRTSASSI